MRCLSAGETGRAKIQAAHVKPRIQEEMKVVPGRVWVNDARDASYGKGFRVASFGFLASSLVVSSRSFPETRNVKSATSKEKLITRNLERETRNPQLGTCQLPGPVPPYPHDENEDRHRNEFQVERREWKVSVFSEDMSCN